MRDMNKTKAQLVGELEEMRQRVAVLEASDAEDERDGATPTESEEKLRIVFDSIADGVVVIDLNGKIVEVNESTLRMKGYSDKSEVIGRDGLGFISEKDRKKALELMPDVIEKGHSDPREYSLLTKSGDEVEVEANCRVLHDKEGIPVGLVCVERDISQRKQLEREKEESKEKLRAVFQSIIDAVTVVDIKGDIIEANEAAVRLGGYRSREEVIGHNGFDFIADSSRDKAMASFEKLLSEHYTPPMEFKFKNKDGVEIDAEATASVLRDSDGKIVGFVNVVRDIRERKKMEEQLRSTSEKLSTVLEAMGDGVIAIDVSGNITEANDTAVHMFECGSREKLIGRSALDTIAERDRRKCADVISRSVEASKTPGVIQFTMLTASGREFDAELSTSVLHDSQGNLIGLVGVIRDITERKGMEKELDRHRQKLESMVKERTAELMGVVEKLQAEVTERMRTEDELRESEEKYRSLVEDINEVVYMVDSDGVLLYISPSIESFAGYTVEEVEGRNFAELIHEEDLPRIIENYGRVMEGNAEANEYRMKAKSGELRWMRTSSKPVFVKGRVFGVHGVLMDITERRQAEDALRESEEKLRLMFQSIGDGIIIADAIGNVVDLNEAAASMVGFSKKEDLIGRNGYEFIAEKDYSKAVEFAQKLFVTGHGSDIECTLLKKDGQRFEGHISASLMRDSSGEPAGIVAVARDITESKRIREALRESEEKLRIMFEAITDGVTVTDLEGNFVDANDAAVHMFGCESRDELVGRNGYEFIAEQDKEKATNGIRQVLKRGRARDLQYKLVRKGGMEFDSECGVSLMRDGQGEPTGFIYMFRDITERKGLEREVRDSEERLRIVFESVGEGMLVCDLQGKIEKANEAALRMSGYRREDVIGLNVMDFMLPEEREKAVHDLQKTLAEGITSRPIEYTLLGINGREIEAEFSAALMKDSEGNLVGIVGLARDISERKRMENALRQSEEKLRGIFDSIRDGIVLTDLELNVMEANEAVVKMAGFDTREELVGRNTLDFLVPEDQEKAAVPLPEAVEGRPVEAGEYKVRNNRGEEFDAQVGITTLHDSVGSLSGFVAVVQDVTEQRRMREALEESEARFRDLFRHMSSGVAVYEAVGDGKDFVFRDLNTAGEKISKLKRKKVVGKRLLEVLPGIRDFGLFEVLQRVWKTGKAEHLPDSLYRDERTHGWRENYVYKLPSGEVVSVYDDITERKLAEDALRASEEKLRFMFESISDGFVLTDLEGKIIDVNEALARIAGFDGKEELIGRSGFKLLAGKDSREAAEDVGKALQAGEGGAKEYMLMRDDGREVEVEASASFLRDAAGKPTGIISVVRDITERKRMDKELRDSEEKLRTMFESIGDAILLLDMKGTVTDANNEACRMLGSRGKEEVVGKSSWEFIDSGDRGRTKEYIGKAVKVGKGGAIEFTLKDPDGKNIRVESRTSILHDSDGNEIGIVGISRDISERKRMEEELMRSEEQMRFMFDAIGDGIIMVDLEGKIVEVNQAALRMSGCKKKEDMIGRNAFDFVAERDRPRALEEMGKNIVEGHGSLVAYASVDVNGREFEAEAIGDMMRDGEGNPVGFITAVRDITERRRMEEVLRGSEEKLRTMFGAMRDGIIVTDMDDVVLDANEAAFHMGKFSIDEELIGRSFFDLVVEKDRAMAAKAIVQALKAGRGAMMEYTYIDAQGGNYIGETSSAMLYGPADEPVGFVNVIRDTTERRRMEAALRDSEEKLRVMFDSIADGITVTDMEGRILDVNDEACRMLGCSSKEGIVGSQYFEIIGKEQGAKAVKYMQRILKGKPGGTIEYTLPSLKGGEVNIEATATVLRDSSGEPTAIVGVARDVTERKRMEAALRDREERLRTLLQSTPDFIMEADRDGKILFINYTVPEMTAEQAIGTSLYDYISPESQEVYVSTLGRIFETGEPARVETVGLGPEGRTSYYQTRFAPVERDGRVDTVLVIATDVTERRRAEEAVRESEQKLRIMFATIKDGLIMTDMNGRVVDTNDEALKIYGYSDMGELIGKSGLELIAEEDRARAIEASWEAFAKGHGAMLEYSMLRKDGGKVAGEGSVTLLSDSAGNPTGIVVLTRDISERKLMETALRESEEMARGMLESAATGVYLVQDRLFQYVSPLFADISGYTSDELKGTDPLGYVHPNDRERVRKAAIKSLKGKSSLPQEYRFIRKDGEAVWILEKVASIQYQGKPATIASFMDVTERRRAEEALRRSEEKLRSFMDSATDFFTIWDSELNLVDLNEAALNYPLVPRSKDIKRENFIGKNILELEPGIKGSGRYKSYQDVIRTGKPFFGEDVYHHPAGDLHLAVSAFKAGEGLGIISTDVTERRRSEEELRSRKEELEKRTNQLLALQKVTTSLQSTLELKEVLQQVAEGVTTNLGYDHSFIMVLDEKEEVLKGTVFSTGEKWLDRVDEMGQVMGSSLEELRVPLVKGYSHAVDEGLEGRAVVAHHLHDIAEPPLTRDACDAVWKMLESKAAVTLPIMAMERQVGAILAFSAGEDITDIDLEPLKILADQAGVAIVNATIYQGAAEIAQRLAVIGTLSRIVGSSMDIKEVYQAFTNEIKDVIDFDHASIAMVEGEQLRFYAVSSVTETAMGDGVVVPILGSATEWVVDNRRTNIEDDFAVERQFPIDDVYFEEGLRSMIRVPLFYKDEVFGSFNLAIRRPNAYGDRERGILEQVAGPIAAAIENSRLFIRVKEHEEELIKAYDELKVAQDYMVRSERLRALGEMAGGVAHDFNNILAIVLGRAQLALEDVKDEKLKKDLQIIEQTAIDAASTVRRLQDFARVRVDRAFEEVDINQVVNGALEMVESRQMELKERQGIIIEVNYQPGKLAPVLGDASEMREALVNILFNSIDAMPQGGRIDIKSWRDGKWVALSVSDTGVGMSEETRLRIFEPFFTTRAPRGSGLGLAVTYGIITRHGGRIEVESGEGEGATFNIRLPVSSGAAVKKQPERKAAAVENAAILLVDDDVEVSQVLELMLKQMGHRVTTVNTGEAAVNTFEIGKYDLVITDLGMPDMPGSDVARAVKDIRPGTPVLLITGWGVQLDREELPEVDGVVAKPFSKETLSQQLAKLLAPKKRKKKK
jgi:PAS domain S-box-containing protein